ncbi:MAG TPA: hypothetical protein PKD09_05990 [Aggregatilinea sp.]|uniref:hypothetical protein n=1 Tax=Aggregatilinea sp. TaxID=2806333 RepID=UPI002C165EA8|nr:hypothetical protein [Aggregatilinea sp.]HML21176.1 hypothetical protein [Aggregatilinea sp.]
MRNHALILALCILIVLPGASGSSSARASGPHTFAGLEWYTRSEQGAPPSGGYNLWWDGPEAAAFEDTDRDGEADQVTLRTHSDGGTWYSTEMFTSDPVPYGDYCFYVDAALDGLDAALVFGMFLYEDDAHELDIEFSLWGEPDAPNNAQFVVQRGDGKSYAKRFAMAFEGAYSTHCIRWQPDSVVFESYHGHTTAPENRQAIWRYDRSLRAFDAERIPRSGQTTLILNLWLVDGAGDRFAPDLTGASEVAITGITHPAQPPA